MREDLVGDGRILERHPDHLGTGYFAAFANSISHFAGLA